MAQVLVVDDEVGIRELLCEILSDEGHMVSLAESAQAARKIRQSMRPDLVLLDIWMPDMDGVSLLKEWAANGQLTMPVVMMSGHATIDTAVEATRIGAVDFLEKPITLQKLLSTIKRVLQMHGTNRRSGPTLAAFSRVRLISHLKERLDRAAQNSHVIILLMSAPNGLAELCARSLHHSNTPFIDGLNFLTKPVMNDLSHCTGGVFFISDFFALEEEARHNFLSILSDLESARMKIVIGTTLSPLPALESAVLQKLSSVWIRLPPLAENRDDIPELATYLLMQMVDRGESPLRRFSSAALNVLRTYSWPGDFAELMEVIRNLALISPNEEISSHDVAYSLRYASDSILLSSPFPVNLNQPLREAREEFERLYFHHHIEKNGTNMTRLAEASGLERTHLYRKLRQLGISMTKRSEPPSLYE